MLAVGTGVWLKLAAAYVFMPEVAWIMFSAAITSQHSVLASFAFRALYRFRVEVGIEIVQLSNPVTSLLLGWTVNLEFQYGLSLALVFKDLNDVASGLTVWANILVGQDSCDACSTKSLSTAGDLHWVSRNEVADQTVISTSVVHYIYIIALLCCRLI